MRYGRIIQRGGFAAGLGYGMGLTVGLIGGAVLVGGAMAATLGGYLAVRKHLRNHKKQKEQRISNIEISNIDSEMEEVLS